MSSDIHTAIAEGVVTADDFNRLIEANMKSVKERVRRVTEPIDHNRNNDSEGHSRLAPPNRAARAAKRPGGGSMNDPRKTGRGRAMLRKQAAKHGVSEGVSEHKPWFCETCLAEFQEEPSASKCPQCSGDIVPSNQENVKRYFKESSENPKNLILKHADEDELYGVWWNEKAGKVRVSNGDWAEYGTAELMKELEKRFGKGNVEMDSEIGAPPGPDWVRIIPESKGPKKPNQFDEAVNFIKSKSGSPITESDISGIRDKSKLRKLALRLMREPSVDRDWLWNLVGITK